MPYTLHIRRGQITNTDPLRRYYNGAYFSSRVDWGPWELWIKNNFYRTREDAELAARLFERENQQLKVVEVPE